MNKYCMVMLVIYIHFIVFTINAGALSEAQSYYKKGDYHKALDLYKKNRFSAPNPALVYFNMANCWYQMDSLANAVVCYEMSLEEAPAFFKAWLNLGILKYNLNDFPGVIAALERARSIEPENIQLLLVLASAYRRLDDISNVIPLLEQAVTIEPGMEKGYFMLYEANYSLGNLDDAARWLKACPDSASERTREKYTFLAELFEEMGQLNEALSWWRRVKNSYRQDRWANYRYVSLLARQGTVLLALAEADKCLDEFSDFGELALLAGSIAVEQGMLQRASRYFMKAWNIGYSEGLVGLQNIIALYKSNGDELNAQDLRKMIAVKK